MSFHYLQHNINYRLYTKLERNRIGLKSVHKTSSNSKRSVFIGKIINLRINASLLKFQCFVNRIRSTKTLLKKTIKYL